MTSKNSTPIKTRKQPKISHPGMMGDGTEEQNLNERGDPSARISKEDIESAFGKQPKSHTK
jgi:hypothetical protein